MALLLLQHTVARVGLFVPFSVCLRNMDLECIIFESISFIFIGYIWGFCSIFAAKFQNDWFFTKTEGQRLLQSRLVFYKDRKDRMDKHC